MQKSLKKLLVFRAFQTSELSRKDDSRMQMTQIVEETVNLPVIKDIRIKTIKIPISALQISKCVLQRKCQQCEKWVFPPLLWKVNWNNLQITNTWVIKGLKNMNTFDANTALTKNPFSVEVIDIQTKRHPYMFTETIHMKIQIHLTIISNNSNLLNGGTLRWKSVNPYNKLLCSYSLSR